jgi:hypothetical protein
LLSESWPLFLTTPLINASKLDFGRFGRVN